MVSTLDDLVEIFSNGTFAPPPAEVIGELDQHANFVTDFLKNDGVDISDPEIARTVGAAIYGLYRLVALNMIATKAMPSDEVFNGHISGFCAELLWIISQKHRKI